MIKTDVEKNEILMEVRTVKLTVYNSSVIFKSQQSRKLFVEDFNFNIISSQTQFIISNFNGTIKAEN